MKYSWYSTGTALRPSVSTRKRTGTYHIWAACRRCTGADWTDARSSVSLDSMGPTLQGLQILSVSLFGDNNQLNNFCTVLHVYMQYLTASNLSPIWHTCHTWLQFTATKCFLVRCLIGIDGRRVSAVFGLRRRAPSAPFRSVTVCFFCFVLFCFVLFCSFIFVLFLHRNSVLVILQRTVSLFTVSLCADLLLFFMPVNLALSNTARQPSSY